MEMLKDYLDPAWIEIFEIEGFAERMAPIRQTVRLALQRLAGRLAELMTDRDVPVFPHVASHMRRRVNPPNETWLALGPAKRGYKAWAHMGVFIGKGGCSVRFVVKDEAEGPKKSLGQWLRSDPRARKWFKSHPEVLDYDLVHGTGMVGPSLTRSPQEIGERLLDLKTAGGDWGWILPFETPVADLVERLESLVPFYRAANGS